MGCDIHMFCESRHTVNGKTAWHNADNWRINRYRREDGEPDYCPVQIYRDRDYDLFAALADVRNYKDIDPISMPRGLPADVSDAIKGESDGWGADGHSHTYLSLQELKSEVERLPVLALVIEPLEQRKREVFWLYGDDPRDDLDDQIRTVFWFDN